MEQFLADLKAFGWERHDLDPLERVLHARWAAYRVAHAMRHKTSNLKARQIVRRISRPD